MNDRGTRIIIFALVFVAVLVPYLVSVAPTASFWDCGELAAACCTMGIPHPPGTPLFVAFGRLFALIPFSPESAFRTNMVPVLFGAFSCGLVYLLVLKLIGLAGETGDRRRETADGPRSPVPHLRWLPHVAGVFGALSCAFAFSYWDNSVETEVYGPCVVVALCVLYMALVWREKLKDGTGDNRYILAAIFLLFLSAGIHFTPMLAMFAVLFFALVVDRDAVLHLRIFELIAGYLMVLTATELGLKPATFVAIPLMLVATWLGLRVMERSEKTAGAFYGLGLLFLVFVIGYAAAGNGILDDTVLFIASPTAAFIERWVQSPPILIAFVAGYGAYLYWLHRQGKLDARYVGLMLGLIFLAGSVQFIMYIRARLGPAINEVNPSNWRDFVSVLKREQYDPMKLFPRRTQFLTEGDWQTNRNVHFSLPMAYFEQVKSYVRYFFWQWGNARYFDIFQHVGWQALLGLVTPLLGLWGMWHQVRREKRSFILIFVAFLVASLGLITYLNLEYSPTDPRPLLKFREVRERDYFYAFSFVFYAVFAGVGAYAFLRRVADRCERIRLRSRSRFGTPGLTSALTSTSTYAVSGILLAFGFVPMYLNYPDVTRHGNWIPAEYGYNFLVSCPGEHAVLFTNGDNDTFPLWFLQTVPSLVANYDPHFGKNVAVANLSLLNANWYCKQLKRWGAPISFTEAQIDQLPEVFTGRDNREIQLKDVMMRDILATSAGIKLQWPDDYACTPDEFRARIFTAGYNPRTPVYYSTTVSRSNLVDVEPNLRLEGLVNRVVPEQGVSQVDTQKTRHLLYDVYVMTSILDPGVRRDENTRNLLRNYAACYVALAGEYQKADRNIEAQQALEKALALDLDPDRRVPLFYHASTFAMLNDQYDRALAYLDSIESRGFRDPELMLRRGYAHEAKGEFALAESTYRAALAADSTQSDPLQALCRLYLDETRDTVKARIMLQQWLRRAPEDTAATRMLKEIS